MSAVEVNFDGLVGPSHNYGGLSVGNLASSKHGGLVSHPREAALQGLEKMRRLVNAGLVQGILPPQQRPSRVFLRQLGYEPRVRSAIPKLAQENPDLLKPTYSASSMWAANAATVSPSADTGDGRLHLTTANLSTMLHRSIEHTETTALLRAIFADPNRFAVHDALPAHPDFSDEGAANHVRLTSAHGDSGLELFVFGRDGPPTVDGFPARQTLKASQAVARSHGLEESSTVFAQQSHRAIAAGAFHNDVVCVGCLDTLFFHEHAFENTDQVLSDIRKAAQGTFELQPVMVPESKVPIEDAVKSYLFNSQLLTLPGEDRLVLVAPTETRETASTYAYCQALVAGNGPISRVDYVDVRQSMMNGGGPACLRLRVVMSEEEIAAAHPRVFLDNARIDTLQDVVARTYRKDLSPQDLADPAFAEECMLARSAVLEVLGLDILN